MQQLCTWVSSHGLCLNSEMHRLSRQTEVRQLSGHLYFCRTDSRDPLWLCGSWSVITSAAAPEKLTAISQHLLLLPKWYRPWKYQTQLRQLNKFSRLVWFRLSKNTGEKMAETIWSLLLFLGISYKNVGAAPVQRGLLTAECGRSP